MRYLIKTFDCAHGRQIQVVIPDEPGSAHVAFLTLEDRQRNHPLLAWRDKPAITLSFEGDLFAAARQLAAEEMDPEQFAIWVSLRHPKLAGSEWRRALLYEFCRSAVPAEKPTDRGICF